MSKAYLNVKMLRLMTRYPSGKEERNHKPKQLMWLPVLRVLYLVTQKGPATAFSLTWSSIHIGRSLSIHSINHSICPN